MLKGSSFSVFYEIFQVAKNYKTISTKSSLLAEANRINILLFLPTSTMTIMIYSPVTPLTFLVATPPPTQHQHKSNSHTTHVTKQPPARPQQMQTFTTLYHTTLWFLGDASTSTLLCLIGLITSTTYT